MKHMIFASALLCVNHAQANMFKSLWNNIKSQPDISVDHDGITKQYITSNMYVYRLTPNTPAVAQPAPATVLIEPVAQPTQTQIIREIEQQNEKHADNVPIVNKIDVNPESESIDTTAQQSANHVLYGEGSPLQDDAVIQAWAEADAAQRRLEEHREYMEQVRQARKRTQQSKTTAAATRIAESN